MRTHTGATYQCYVLTLPHGDPPPLAPRNDKRNIAIPTEVPITYPLIPEEHTCTHAENAHPPYSCT